MHAIHFNSMGNVVAALFFFSLPLFIVVAGALARGENAESKRWHLARRYGYLPLLIPLILYYGIIYRWLFFDQFYRIHIDESGAWRLVYYLPPRERVIQARNIERVDYFTGDIWTYKTIRILISTADGKQYLSAQVSPRDKDFYINLLTRYRHAQ